MKIYQKFGPGGRVTSVVFGLHDDHMVEYHSGEIIYIIHLTNLNFVFKFDDVYDIELIKIFRQ